MVLQRRHHDLDIGHFTNAKKDDIAETPSKRLSEKNRLY